MRPSRSWRALYGGSEIDIDDLADELKNAARLLEICREKIRKAELEVTQIVQALDEDEDESTGE